MHFNWEQISADLISIVWRLLITTIIFYLLAHWGRKIIARCLTGHKKPKNKRTRTITALITSAFQYTVIFFYLFGVLSILGVPIGALLASAGIFSLALGLGAQGFVSDLVNGFFILSEDQFDVGDTVVINQEVGTVVQLGLRTTRIKTSNGAIVFIPNRNITVVKNLAHNAVPLTISLQLAADNNFTKVSQLLAQTNAQLRPPHGTVMAKPEIIGLTAQTGQTVTFAVSLKVKPDQQSRIKNFYLLAYLKALQEHQIKLAPCAATSFQKEKKSS